MTHHAVLGQYGVSRISQHVIVRRGTWTHNIPPRDAYFLSRRERLLWLLLERLHLFVYHVSEVLDFIQNRLI